MFGTAGAVVHGTTYTATYLIDPSLATPMLISTKRRGRPWRAPRSRRSARRFALNNVSPLAGSEDAFYLLDLPPGGSSLPTAGSCARPHSRRHLYVTSYTEGFSHFVTSMTAPVASCWSVRRVGLVQPAISRQVRRCCGTFRSFNAVRVVRTNSGVTATAEAIPSSVRKRKAGLISSLIS